MPRLNLLRESGDCCLMQLSAADVLWCVLNVPTTCPHSSLLQTMRADRCRAHVHHLPPLPCITVNFSNLRLSRAAQQIKLLLLAQIVVAFFLYVLLLALVAGFCVYLLLLCAAWRMTELNAASSSVEKPVPGE